MNRRSFLISSISLVGTSLIQRKSKPVDTPKKQITEKNLMVDNIIKTLNPSVTDSILSVHSQLTESSKLIDKNLETIKDTDTLAYSNSDALMQGYVAPITYASSLLSRLPIEAIIKLVSHNLSPKQISELTTISSFHGHTFIVLTLRNFIVQEGRDIILDLLEKNPKYKNDPRNIPYSILLKELGNNKESISQNFKKNLTKITSMQETYINSLSTNRGWIDTAIVGSSFPIAFSNTGLSRFFGMVLRHGLSGRNMILRDIEKGDPKKIEEQTIRASTNLVTYPSNLAVNAIFQEILKKTNWDKNISKDTQVQSHFRDLLSTIFSFGVYQTGKIKMQQAMETSLRANKNINNPFAKFLKNFVYPQNK